MKILVQNKKMKKSSNNNIVVYNFGIPAFMSRSGLKTCPNAGACATGCYARSGAYIFSNVKNAYEQRLELTLQNNFAEVMQAEIDAVKAKAKKKNQKVVIRIHDSGDFYSLAYFKIWDDIAKKNEDVLFYAYTKQIEMLSPYYNSSKINLTFSFGGKQDSMIEVSNHRHAKVFESLIELEAAGYTDASDDDLITAFGQVKNIGLVYHGTKKFENTLWKKTA